jgi:integrase
VTDWTLHDLRRTFATIISERLGVQPVVVDRMLNHVSGALKGVAAVYQRGEYLAARREAREKYAAFVSNNPDNR